MTTNKLRRVLPGWLGILMIFTTWFIFFAGRFSGQTLLNIIKGSGMSPTLNPYDIIITSLDKSYSRFDLATYNLTADQEKIAEQIGVVKGIHVGRVVGLPGEVVEVTKDSLLINRDKLLSINVKGERNKVFAESQVPIDKYFILLDGNISEVGERIEVSGVDSRYFGFIKSDQMRKVIKIYRKSDLPWNATSELLSGFSILLFISVFPLYVKRISRKNLFLTILVVISYVFIIVFPLASVAFSSQGYFYNSVQVLLASHYHYMGGIINIFGNNVFSVLMKEFGAFAAGALSMLAIYEFFFKNKKSNHE
jgi:signal peptidase I